jgi:hypothetical protein
VFLRVAGVCKKPAYSSRFLFSGLLRIAGCCVRGGGRVVSVDQRLRVAGYFVIEAGWAGALAGAGWTIGARIVAFEIIVPFTALSWIWMIAFGAVM